LFQGNATKGQLLTMSGSHPNGSFPLEDPVVYTTDSPRAARRSLEGRLPGFSRWFHATSERNAVQAIFYGLIPSCWHGGDCCAVCGHDALEDVHRHHGSWILEVESPALSGQLKAWWVPASNIKGVWRHGAFESAECIRERTVKPKRLVDARPCICPLRMLVVEQILAWEMGQTN